jgi:hypothetical protein
VTVQHNVGSLDVENGEIVNRMSGKKGFLGREQWHREEIIPVETVLAAETGRLGDVRLTFYLEGEDLGKTFLRCTPLAGVGELLQALKEYKPAISVTTSQSDLANELRRWVPDIEVSDRFSEGIAAQDARIEVKTYRNEDEYQRDAPRMVTQGWRMEAQTAHRGKVNLGRTIVKGGLFLPWAVMRPSRQGDPLTVTWYKEAKAAVDLTAQSAPTIDEDVITKLKRLAELRDSGILTSEEFDNKKAELLARL